MAADDRLYRITYESGRSGSVCNRRSLAGKLGYHNEQVRKRARGRWHDRGFIIAKIERAPSEGWQDVTGEFLDL